MTKVFINSIPKSGTYRVSALLQQAGVEISGLHITDDKVWDYSNVDVETGRRDPDTALMTDTTPAEALSGIQHNQALVGHFGFSIRHCALLNDFTTVFLIRDIREVIVSWCRWQVFSGQSPRLAAIDDQQQMIVSFLELSARPTAQIVMSLLPWYLYLPQQHVFRVNDLKQPQTLERLFNICGCPQNQSAIENIMQNVQREQTLTKVPGGTLVDDYWSEDAEQIFQLHHLEQANQLLGY